MALLYQLLEVPSSSSPAVSCFTCYLEQGELNTSPSSKPPEPRTGSLHSHSHWTSACLVARLRMAGRPVGLQISASTFADDTGEAGEIINMVTPKTAWRGRGSRGCTHGRGAKHLVKKAKSWTAGLGMAIWRPPLSNITIQNPRFNGRIPMPWNSR